MKHLTLTDLNTQYIITFVVRLATTVNALFFITFISYELSHILSTFLSIVHLNNNRHIHDRSVGHLI
jgi:hypothetical protein